MTTQGPDDRQPFRCSSLARATVSSVAAATASCSLTNRLGRNLRKPRASRLSLLEERSGTEPAE